MKIENAIIAAILALGVAAGTALATAGYKAPEPDAAYEASDAQLLPLEAQQRFFGI